MTIRRVLAAVVGAAVFAAPAPALAAVDLSTYVRIGRYDLPEPTRTTPPAGSLLAQEVSAVTYNGTRTRCSSSATAHLDRAGVQDRRADRLDDAARRQPAGHRVLRHRGPELHRQRPVRDGRGARPPLVRFTYAAEHDAHARADAERQARHDDRQRGLRGPRRTIPFSGGFIVVKEINPHGVFQTTVDWAAGTATNGSPTTVNSTNLFDPALPRACSTSPTCSRRPTASCCCSARRTAKLVNATRTGTVTSSLNLRHRRRGPRGRDDGPRRPHLRHQRERRRRRPAPAAVGLRARPAPGPERSADRGHAHQPDRVGLEHRHAREGRRHRRHRRRPGHEHAQPHRRRRVASSRSTAARCT